MKKVILCGLLALAACTPVQPLSEYAPVVDHAQINEARYQNDLQACRSIALKAQQDYEARQQKEMQRNLLVGVVTGAVLGAALGAHSGHAGDVAAAGAVYGAAAGAASNDYDYDLVHYGPRRVVDRCMSNRGYAILNDLGRG